MGTRTFKLSLGEWVILVGIVGLVAASVRPTVSQAVEERKLSDLVVRLHEVRSAIALYKVNHGGLYPGQTSKEDAVDAAGFERALTTPRASGRKPYLSAIPANPYIDRPDAATHVVCVNDPAAEPDFDADAGWWFNAATGQFCALNSQFHAEY